MKTIRKFLVVIMLVGGCIGMMGCRTGHPPGLPGLPPPPGLPVP